MAVGERQGAEIDRGRRHSQVSGLGCRYGYRIRFGNQTRGLHPNLNTRTRDPMAETRDLKMCPQPIIRSPVSPCSTVFPTAKN